MASTQDKLTEHDMALSSLIGLDHVVILVHDLSKAAEQWRSLGFTVAPAGLHSASMGTANHTIMLQDDYLELMGVVSPTERNAPSRSFLAERGEGIERAAFTGRDADAGVRELQAHGFAALGPYDFSRPVETATGQRTEARFRTFLWPTHERPGGLRIFACEHLTRDVVWLPELTRHRNTAVGVERVEMLSRDPAEAAAHMSRLIDQPAVPEPDGALKIDTGGGRGSFVFLDRSTLVRRHTGIDLTGLPDEGAVALVLRVTDVAAATSAVGAAAAWSSADVIKIAPNNANGVILVLTKLH